jgi:hypothetical protein
MTGSTLILLVGSNPLPNYLSASALQPGKVVLVYTDQTKDAKDRLRGELRKVLTGSDFRETFVENAACATDVRRKLDDILMDNSGAMLNYTGGTKVMAAHALRAFYDNAGLPQHASYLDEGGSGRPPCLRFDDGTHRTLAGTPGLNLDSLFALHAITHKLRTERTDQPTLVDAGEILAKVLNNVELAKELYIERERLETRKSVSAALEKPFVSAHFGLTLSQPQIPWEGMSKSLFQDWYKFIGGEWFEEWVGEQVKGSLKPEPRDVTVGVNAYRDPQKKVKLEVDIAVLKEHRSYFVSCTTDTKELCKSKLFEIAVRSRQLGGDLSRAALVCLADEEKVSALRGDINDVWGASNTTQVFGLPDVRCWSDAGGTMPNLDSLKKWLEN